MRKPGRTPPAPVMMATFPSSKPMQQTSLMIPVR